MKWLQSFLSAAPEVINEAAGQSNKIEMDFNLDRFLGSFYYMGVGMLCIFAVIGVIVLSTVLLNKFTAKK